MIVGPKLEDRSEQPYVGIRTQVTVQEFGSGIIPQLHSEVFKWLDKQGVKPSGPPLIRYHVIDMADHMDVEMAWPVTTPLAGEGRVRGGVLPAGRYASLLYRGDYSGLMDANGVLVGWARENGIEWDRCDDEHSDAFRSRYESYITDPGDEPDPAKWETEVAIKVADK